MAEFYSEMISVIIGTNTFSIFHQKQNHNAEQIKYNKERSDRINKRLLEEAKNHYLIEELKKELEQCKESKK